MLYRQVNNHVQTPSKRSEPQRIGQLAVLADGADWWVRGQRTNEECPVCSDQGPHSLQLSVPSSITPDEFVTFARCRQCDCRFVVNYQTAAYEDPLQRRTTALLR